MENTNTQNLPADIFRAIESCDVYIKLEKIGDKYGLLLNQIGDLNLNTEKLMIGKLKSSEFVDTIAKDLEISSQTAEKIVADINTEIFANLRESLRKMQEEAGKAPVQPSTPPPLPPQPPKQNFVIEKPQAPTPPIYNDSNLKRESVLNDLENIEKLKPENANNFVEHLLSNPVVSSPSTPAPVKKQPMPPIIPRKDGVDPYREAV